MEIVEHISVSILKQTTGRNMTHLMEKIGINTMKPVKTSLALEKQKVVGGRKHNHIIELGSTVNNIHKVIVTFI